MQLSLNELAFMIGSDTTLQPDGCSNQDRTNYICEVLGIDCIDLNAHIDYNYAMRSDCPEFVQASLHLIKLQMQYLKAAFFNGFVSKDDFELKEAWFALWIRKLQWHVDHLNRDEPTPPFQFIN